jgi:hypothetical protein
VDHPSRVTWCRGRKILIFSAAKSNEPHSQASSLTDADKLAKCGAKIGYNSPSRSPEFRWGGAAKAKEEGPPLEKYKSQQAAQYQ